MQKTTNPRVSIVILNWNGLDDTVECLESLKKLTYPNYKVIVVDNGSKGNDAQVLEDKFGDYIHLIKNDKNYGYAGGNNIGIRYVLSNFPTDYFLLLNNDTVVDPEFLTEMIKVADSNQSIGVTGGKIYYYDNPTQLQFIWGRVDFWRGRVLQTPKILSEKFKSMELDRGQYDRVTEADWVTGCCFLIKRSALEIIGLLDESYFSYWEETDYCMRAKKTGFRIVYVPRSKIWHKTEQTAKKITGFTRYYLARNRFRFMKKHATKWQYRCFLLYFFGFYFWLATGYYLIYLHSTALLTSFYRGVKDGLHNSQERAGVYVTN